MSNHVETLIPHLRHRITQLDEEVVDLKEENFSLRRQLAAVKHQPKVLDEFMIQFTKLQEDHNQLIVTHNAIDKIAETHRKFFHIAMQLLKEASVYVKPRTVKKIKWWHQRYLKLQEDVKNET